MPISEATIEEWEQTYDVDIRYDPEAGSFTVQSVDRTPLVEDVGIAGAAAAQFNRTYTDYKVSGEIIDETIVANDAFTRAAGVEPSDDMLADLTKIGQQNFEETGGWGALNDVRTPLPGSPLQNVTAVSGALRTDGQIPPEVWLANPSIGGSGAGAELVPGGSQGGSNSEPAIPHDIDHFLGSLGYGPMKDLKELIDITGNVPSGLHGLGPGLEHGQALLDGKAFGQLQAEQALLPSTENFPDYASPRLYGYPMEEDGWAVQMDPIWEPKVREGDVIPGSDGPQALSGADPIQVAAADGTLTAEQVGERFGTEVMNEYTAYIENGGQREIADAAIAEYAQQDEIVVAAQTVDEVDMHERDYAEDDYGIV